MSVNQDVIARLVDEQVWLDQNGSLDCSPVDRDVIVTGHHHPVAGDGQMYFVGPSHGTGATQA